MAFRNIKKLYDEQQTRLTRVKFMVSQVILVTVDIFTDILTAVELFKYVLNLIILSKGTWMVKPRITKIFSDFDLQI
jgi:hypothetical protein